MQVSFFLPDANDWPAFLRAAHEAEAAGVERILLVDHLSFGPPQIEAWTAASALAAATSRVGIGFGVLSATFRPPGLLAKMADSLDRLSGGRLTIGLGAGLDPEEHERYGLAFPSPGERLRRLDETCIALRRLSERPITLAIGASGDRALEIVARHADEWNCGAIYLDRVESRFARLAALADRPIVRSVNVPVTAGPVPDTERARRYNLRLGLHGTADQMVERAAELRSLGFDGIWLFNQSREAFERSLEILPRLQFL